MNRYVIGSHGGYAEGMQSALRLILGEKADQVRVYALQPGEHPDAFFEALAPEIQAHEEDTFYVMSDLYGASVSNAFAPLSMLPNCHCIAGINLQFALDLLLTDEPLDDARIEEKIAEAKEGFRLVKLDLTANAEEEDF